MTKSEFKNCFDQYFDSIRNFIAYRCGDGDLASDIAQEVFMKAWEKDLIFDLNKIKGLLYKMANDLWIDHYRKQATAKNHAINFISIDVDSNNPSEQLQYLELKQEYEKTLTILPLNQREVFLMSRMENLTYKEIAERLSISVKAVEKRMKLALLTLKKALGYGNE